MYAVTYPCFGTSTLPTPGNAITATAANPTQGLVGGTATTTTTPTSTSVPAQGSATTDSWPDAAVGLCVALGIVAAVAVGLAIFFWRRLILALDAVAEWERAVQELIDEHGGPAAVQNNQPQHPAAL